MQFFFQALLSDDDAVSTINTVLTARGEREDNWAYDWWLRDMYLANPIPLPVNSNPGWVFPEAKFREGSADQAVYMARLAHGLCSFKQDMEK